MSVLGEAKKWERDRVLRSWRRAAGRTRAAPRPQTIEEHLAMVRSFGITTVLITEEGRQMVPPAQIDEGNPPNPEASGTNITSHTFPESVE